MKKLLILPLCLVLVGCGNKLNCIKDVSQGKQKIQFAFKEDKAVKMKRITVFDDQKTADAFCNSEKLINTNATQVTCSSNKVSAIITDSYTLGKTKEELKKTYENQGYTCK